MAPLTQPRPGFSSDATSSGLPCSPRGLSDLALTHLLPPSLTKAWTLGHSLVGLGRDRRPSKCGRRIPLALAWSLWASHECPETRLCRLWILTRPHWPWTRPWPLGPVTATMTVLIMHLLCAQICAGGFTRVIFHPQTALSGRCHPNAEVKREAPRGGIVCARSHREE